MDEQSLAILCSKKDRQAQEELYKRYAARVFTLCLRYSDKREKAQDLLHDSFLKAFEKMPSFRYQGSGSLLAWINRIAINTALADIRRHKFRIMFLGTSIPELLPEPTDEELNLIPMEKLLEFISNLPESQRAVFNMFCMDGYTHKEIAEQLGISMKGSSSILARAKNSLRKQINEYIKTLGQG